MATPTSSGGASGASLQSQIQAWTVELEEIEKEKASLTAASGDASLRRKQRRLSGRSESSGGGSAEGTGDNSRLHSPGTDRGAIERAAPPSTAAPSAHSHHLHPSSSAPPPTAVATSGGRAARRIQASELEKGLEELQQEMTTPVGGDPLTSSSSRTPRSPAAPTNARHYHESEDLLQLDENEEDDAQLEMRTRAPKRERRSHRADPHGNVVLSLPLDNLDCQSGDSPLPSAERSAPPPTAIAQRPVASAKLSGSRRSSLTAGGLLPSLDAGALRAAGGSHSGSLPRTPNSGDLPERRTASGSVGVGHGTMVMLSGLAADRASARNSLGASGSTTPGTSQRQVARRQPPNAQLAPLGSEDEEHSTLDLSALQASLSPNAGYQYPSDTTKPERTSLSSLAAARAERRRSLPGANALAPLGAMPAVAAEAAPAISHRRTESTLNSRRSAAGNESGTRTPTDSVSSMPTFPYSTGSPSRLQRPTTPYSNSANFQEISKRRSLPPIGLAAVSGQLGIAE